MVLRRMAVMSAFAALAMLPAPEAAAQRPYGSIRSPTKYLGEIRPRQERLGRLRGPRGSLSAPGDAPIPSIGSGFVMQAQKQDKGTASDAIGNDAHLAVARDIPNRILSCWSPPASTGNDLEVTVRMSFSKTGEVIGEPRVTYVKAGKDEVLRDTLRSSILSALRACTPLRFTPAFGQAIAGRSFAIRFIAPAARKPASSI